MFFHSKCPRSPNAAEISRSLPRILSGSMGTSGATRIRKYPESVPKPINYWLHIAGREMFANSKMPSNGRFPWERPPTFCRKTSRKRSDRLRIWPILAKVYMSGNSPGFRNRSSRECSAKPAATARKPRGGSVGIRIHSAADARNSGWNEFELRICDSTVELRKATRDIDYPNSLPQTCPNMSMFIVRPSQRGGQSNRNVAVLLIPGILTPAFACQNFGFDKDSGPLPLYD